MQFPPAFLDQLRSRLSPSEVIGRKVNLKHKARGEYLGLCPFHNEKTPSFTVSDEKGFYHCFGCGEHGDIVKFLTATSGLTFIEAVTQLAGEAGMELPKLDKKEQERYRKMTTLYDVVEEACKWFENQMNEQALNYLSERGIDDKVIKTFRLGFAPDNRGALKEHMLSKGYNEKQLLDTGLVILPEDESKESYDRFRGRIIFPIADEKGRIIAFGGRIIGDGQPKYLNSPETDLFQKGRVLYGFHLARDVAYKKKNIVAVEGYMDVIALHKAGIVNAVAPLGTALTDDHLGKLWRVAKEPVICLDGDAAGKRAMAKVAENSIPYLKPGYSVRFAMLPKGQDPDDVIKNHGVSAIRKILGSSVPLSDALWKITESSNSFSTPEKKAEFEKKLMKFADGITDETVKNYYRQHFKSRIWEANKFSSNKQEKQEKKHKTAEIVQFASVNKDSTPRLVHEKQLFAVIVNNPEILAESEIEEEFARIELIDKGLLSLRQAILDEIIKQDDINKEKLHQTLEKCGFKHDIEYLEKDIFVNIWVKPDSNIKEIVSLWQYLLKCHNLDLIEEEYIKSVELEQLEKAEELKKQKDMLKNLVEREKMSYEAALDDSI